MTFEEITKKYVYSRYPRATVPEKEKYVRDWLKKVEVSRSIVKDFVKRIGDVKGKKVLDAGCGNGGMSIAFYEAGAIPTGVEVEKELYDIAHVHAQSYSANINFVLYDGTILPLQSNTYDSAISVSVLEHTTDPVLYLQEILRVMKPGGSLYLAFPNKLWPKETHTGLWFLTYLPLFLIKKVIKLFNRNPLEDNNLHFYNYWNMKKMIIEAQDGAYKWVIVPETGETYNKVKKAVKKVLELFGLSYKMFLPHVSVILRKE